MQNEHYSKNSFSLFGVLYAKDYFSCKGKEIKTPPILC